jgi:hypothetical protein
MTIQNPEGDHWPTPHDELLLKATLWQGEEALLAWQAWRADCDLDIVTAGPQRLLPLLRRNLHGQGVRDPLMDKFKGLYRRAWYRNQLLFAEATVLLRAFHEAEIETLVFGATPLVLGYYQDLGLRPVDHLDILIPTAQASAAVSLLDKLNWASPSGSPRAFAKPDLAVACAHRFVSSADHELHLYKHLLPGCCGAPADEDFWQNAVPVRVRDQATQTLNPTDQLMLACLDGTRWNPRSRLSWVADAMIVLGASKIDWERFVAQATQRRLVLRLREALGYLGHRLQAPIPTATLEYLQDLPVSRTEVIEYRANARLFRRGARLCRHWFLYLRSSPSAGRASLGRRLVGFARYFQQSWAVDHLWQVPFVGAARILGGISSPRQPE